MGNIIIPRTFFSFLLIFNFNLHSKDQSDTDSFFGREAPEYPSPDNLIAWIDSRQILTLNGEWSYIVDKILADFYKNQWDEQNIEN